jgi:RNA polymerase sigma factor (sigma-70 family)
VQRMECVPLILASKNRRMGSALTREDLADLGQEVFSSLWSKLDEYRGRSSLEAWSGQFCLFGYMNVYNLRRRRPARISFECEKHERVAPVPLQSSDGQEAQALKSAMQELDLHVARVIELHDFQGWEFTKISRELELPVGTVKSLYYRGLLKMRALLRTRHGILGLF